MKHYHRRRSGPFYPACPVCQGSEEVARFFGWRPPWYRRLYYRAVYYATVLHLPR